MGWLRDVEDQPHQRPGCQIRGGFSEVAECVAHAECQAREALLFLYFYERECTCTGVTGAQLLRRWRCRRVRRLLRSIMIVAGPADAAFYCGAFNARLTWGSEFARSENQ